MKVDADKVFEYYFPKGSRGSHSHENLSAREPVIGALINTLNFSEDQLLRFIKDTPCLIRYVEKQTKKLKDAVMETSPYCFRYIKKPSQNHRDLYKKFEDEVKKKAKYMKVPAGIVEWFSEELEHES